MSESHLRKLKKHRVCGYCGKPYYSRNIRYCSRKCLKEHRKIIYSGENAPGYGKPCSEETKRKISETIKKQYTKGRKHWTQGKRFKLCKVCRKRFQIRPFEVETRICCSKECAAKRRSRMFGGENSHFWKGGLTEESKRLRNSAKFKNWRIKVFERDDYTCRGCVKRGGYLEAHHIKSFSKYSGIRFDVDNGVTLCKECHKKTDNYAHKGKDLSEGAFAELAPTSKGLLEVRIEEVEK